MFLFVCFWNENDGYGYGSRARVWVCVLVFFKLYAFILLLTSTLVPGINYFVVTTMLVWV